MLANFSLAGKVATVTAAGESIGQAIAIALAEAGADISAICRNAAGLAETERAVKATGHRFLTTVVERPPDRAFIQGIVDRTVAELGRLDIVVNAAEHPFIKPFLEMTDADWEQVTAGNLGLTRLLCEVAGRNLVNQGSGSVINITSAMGERAIINCSAYAVSKAAVTELTRALAVEWARSGVTVNAISLGWFEGAGFDTQPLMRYIPAHRAGRPEDIGATAIYLASDAARYINGEVFFLDGGVMAHV